MSAKVEANNEKPKEKPKEKLEYLPATAAQLAELLEASKNLPTAGSEFGSIVLGLGEVKKRAQTLQRQYPDSKDEHSKAHYLLARGGLVIGRNIEAEISNLKFRPVFAEPYSYGANEFDIDNYLRIKKEDNILNSIEQSIKAAAANFDIFVSQHVEFNWKSQKDKICQHFGLVQGNEEKAIGQLDANMPDYGWGKPSIGRIVLGPLTGGQFSDIDTVTATTAPTAAASIAPPSALALESRTIKYARIVAELNNDRLVNKRTPITQKFGTLAETLGSDTQSLQIRDAWKMLQQIILESSEKPIRERKYAQVYCSDDYNSSIPSPGSIALRKQLTNGARSYLEDQFYSQIENQISQYPQESRLGGIPSVLSKVLAFLNLKYYRDGAWTKPNLTIANNVPIWGVLYYMLRSGKKVEALQFVQQEIDWFQTMERTFPSYFKAYVNSPDNILPKDMADRIHTEFNQHIHFYNENISDPFKFAVFKLIGRCDLADKRFHEVIVTAEDWIWSLLALTREDNVELSPHFERFNLADLQTMILDAGVVKRYAAHPVVYFQVLLLTGLFEYSIRHIYNISPVDAVHFAIALTFVGLLRPVDEPAKYDGLLILDSQEQAHIDFAKLIGYYTKGFRRSDPKVAVDYLILICFNKDLPTGSKHLHLCHEALKELVLETREFSRLLGDVRADGTREPGAIEDKMRLIDLADEKEYLQTITEQAAIKADEDGRAEDAILLYQLSEEYDTVVSLVNKRLGEYLTLIDLDRPVYTISEGASLSLSAFADPAQLARNIRELYDRNPTIRANVSDYNWNTGEILARLVNAREAFAKGNYEKSLAEANKTGIVPMGQEFGTTAELAYIRSKAQQFSGLDESVSRNVPSLLLMVMLCCVQIAQQVKSGLYNNQARQQVSIKFVKATGFHCHGSAKCSSSNLANGDFTSHWTSMQRVHWHAQVPTTTRVSI